MRRGHAASTQPVVDRMLMRPEQFVALVRVRNATCSTVARVTATAAVAWAPCTTNAPKDSLVLVDNRVLVNFADVWACQFVYMGFPQLPNGIAGEIEDELPIDVASGSATAVVKELGHISLDSIDAMRRRRSCVFEPQLVTMESSE